MLSNLKSYLRHRPSLTVGLGFASLGIMLGSWLTRLPEMQRALGLSNAELGDALFMMSIGGLLASLITSPLLERFKTGPFSFWSVVLQTAVFLLPCLATGYLSFVLAMLVLGVINGFINVNLNASAAGVERGYQRSILSSSHGMFSIGTMVGAGTASLIAGWGITPEMHLLALAAISIGLHLYLLPTWWRIPHFPSSRPALAWPPRPVMGLVAIAFSVILAEVVVMDWSANYLENTLYSSPFIKGLGFAGFSLSMALGRFYGDSIVGRFGPQRMVTVGSMLGALGILLAVVIPHPVVAILGFTLSGIGFSVGVPLLFSAAARVPGVATGLAIASVATAGILGAMAGRLLVGYIADNFGLGVGLLFAACLAVTGGVLAWVYRWERPRAIA